MLVGQHGRDGVVCISPVERPDAQLTAAACHAGALGVLDLGHDRGAAQRALRSLAGAVREFGVRVHGDAIMELPVNATTVIAADLASISRFPERTVLAQVTSLDEARAAIGAGASGVIAKGSESGGRVGDETTFVLLQRLLAALDVPVWAQGGIGVHAATACFAGGASGIVLDVQLALLRESSLDAHVRTALTSMDGSETALVDGRRVYARTRDGLPSNLAIGQDGALARPIAREFPTVARLVRGIRARITSQLALAAELQPLAPGAPLAQAHGARYPIAQGPMSRVSDRARFAEQVARAGGLPFLALTLMSGEEVRALLVETKQLLGDLPWGVGILGFVPPEVREQQLAVLRELRPPVALIAGGRPSQAAPLEALGTPTYLHVPSPGLLELFLKDRARRFVFEGSECGGHVGPRTSFALWEAQLEKLLAFEHPSELSVLFAGGIHDARSCAMVAAMCAPLASRGAKVGVLMGTAYLFTDEAVACGAIQPTFQRAAVACDRTVLLETSPGHATRCAATEYADAFAREKARLEAEGVSTKEMWAQLEQLNLGRLRIAAKALRRDGDRIVEVDAATQQRDGMFMIGQVAALRRDILTIAELHRQVCEGGAARLAEAAASEADHEERVARGTDVAIIGIAAIFPGAPDTDTYWANVVAGKNAIREVPPERWDVATYYDPAATGESAGRKTPCKWGGFLDDIPFDPLAYGIPPKSLVAIEPVQLLSLEIARRALADAGYADRPFDRERCAVIFGAEAGTDLSSAYNFRALFPHYVGPLPDGLDEALPRLSEDSFPGVLANVIAGRIANRLDLGGVNYTVDAACAASLAAIDMAVKELVSGSSDMVLCGGADLHNSINDYLLFASVHALSPTGQCHTFDAKADGIVLGEGVGCVILKRLADAERDGDRVYAVIKGVAGASDGKSLGLTAPRKDGQVRALDRAYAAADISPASVGLVEAHGTGTIVGDKTELATLTEVYTRAGAMSGTCVLGSVKSQIGHTKCAAGMAGLIKASLAIHHGVLPPTSNLEQPNPAWNPNQSPFAFLDTARPWPAETRVAAVSAFGFGGTNFHAVLTSHREEDAARTSRAWPAELLLFRGATRDDALVTVAQVERLLTGDVHLRDVARTACAHGEGPVQLAIVADSLDDLRGKLARAKRGETDRRGVFAASGVSGKLAFVCPGQGSQKVGMLSELFVAFPRLHRHLTMGRRWAPLVFPPQAFSAAERVRHTEALTDTRVAQPALGMVDLAVAELLLALGIAPDMLCGHSYGELAALGIAGVFDERELLELSATRGELILAAAGEDPGAMAAVAASADRVAPVVDGCGVVIANHNSPKQCVLSGPTPAIESALARVKAAGLAGKQINVACAFHSPVVAAARDGLARRLAAIDVGAPNTPVFSNVTGAPYPSDPDAVRALVAEQVASPVRFASEIEAMYAAGARVFVECGPGQVLTRLVGEILGERPHAAVSCDDGIAGFLRALAQLAVCGASVDAAPLFWDRDAVPLALDAPAPAKRATWVVNGQAARPANEPRAPLVPRETTGSPALTREAPMKSIAKAAVTTLSTAHAQAQPLVTGGEREPTGAPGAQTVVIEYLRNMRSMITAQRDIVLSYLGTVPAPMVEPLMTASVAAPRVIDMIEAAPTVPVASPAPSLAAKPEVIDPLALVIAIVSERTGYPAETLGLDLDLEADLSIDSIKRIEIIGELAQRLGFAVRGQGADADAMVEELASRKTLRSLVAWLVERLASAGTAAAAPPATVPAVDGTAPSFGGAAGRAPVPAVDGTAPSLAVDGTAPSLAVDAGHPAPPNGVRDAKPSHSSGAVGRYRVTHVPAPMPINGHSTFAGKRFALYSRDAAAANALVERLRAEGASTVVLTDGAPVAPTELDAYVEIFDRVDVAAMRALFERIKHAALSGATRVLVATIGNGGGPVGLVKTLALEFPTIVARAVALEAGTDIAAVVHAELHAADPHVEIEHARGQRWTRELSPAEPLAASGAASIGRDSVVLVTGGARGITARVAIALVQRLGCRVELIGRSPAPPPDGPDGDARALRALFAKRVSTPAEIEKEVARALADREIRGTLAALGDRATYHSVDVRAPGFAAVIDHVYATRGRIDAVIHGAGLLEDKLIKHKTGESFERVFATKVTAAQTLVDKLRDDTKLVVLFSSIVGVLGNRGQADYAAAGDALDRLARTWKTGARVVSIDWGPWGGTGMVSPELEREYARRGLALIDPERGIEALLAELGGRGEEQLVLCASDPRALVRPARAAVAHDAHDADA
jgi:acyl transferase domain-containing protein/NAD(P)H-dependent flavin oxidoreductase YrpB (nitropropane dioxygenase family)/NADP-dependent 3-hydroxy acid dehydrogenase YdfG